MTTNDRTEPGVCPHCYRGKVLIDAVTGKPLKPDERTYGANWETCSACNGTGQQPSALDKYNADLGRALRAAGIGQQPTQPDYKCACLEFWDSHHPECPTGFGRPAQPDYDPIAAVEAVEHYEASAKALDALPGGEIKPLPVGLLTNLRCMCGNENCANIGAVTEHIDRLQSALTEAQRENAALRNLAANLQPGPISEALSGQRYTTETELRDQLTAAKAYSDDLETRYHTAHERLTAAQQRIADLERNFAEHQAAWQANNAHHAALIRDLEEKLRQQG